MSVICSSKLGSISKKETLQPKIWVGLRERGKKKERERERERERDRASYEIVRLQP